jgi:protein-S-isoprenylcysteine O-methyltransferase Ste14
MKILSIVGLILMVGGLVGLFHARALLSPSPVVIVVQAAAVALMIWARLTFGLRSFHAAANTTEGGLITHGPYRFVRNPIYTSVVLFAFAGAAAHLSALSVGWALATLAGALLRVFLEERSLQATFPEYPQYAERTPRMIPWIF